MKNQVKQSRVIDQFDSMRGLQLVLFKMIHPKYTLKCRLLPLNVIAKYTSIDIIPVKNELRDGQHIGEVVKALLNVAPSEASKFLVACITSIDP